MTTTSDAPSPDPAPKSAPKPAPVPASVVARRRDNPLTRSRAGIIGIVFLAAMMLACLGSLPWTLTSAQGEQVARYDAGAPREGRLPPSWVPHDQRAASRAIAAMDPEIRERIAAELGVDPGAMAIDPTDQIIDATRAHWPSYALGSDLLGRSLLVRLLAGGGISLTIGISAALLSVGIGTLYGAFAAYAGGKIDSVMMRIVDTLYGLPYILLVVLLAVASDALIDEYANRSGAKQDWAIEQIMDTAQERGEELTRSEARVRYQSDEDLQASLLARASTIYPARDLSAPTRTTLDVLTLLIAIGGVSWLTMARVIRGQVLSLKNQPFVESARAVGASPWRVFGRHLLPNLIGPIVVYATLAVPQAILQESFLSFLGIGVKPPLPSWGNLAAEGLREINTYRSHWWLLLFPCLLLGLTLLAMNFVGEGLREAFDPKRAR